MHTACPLRPLQSVQDWRPKPVSSFPISDTRVASSPKVAAKVPPHCRQLTLWCTLWAAVVFMWFLVCKMASRHPDRGIKSQLRPLSSPKKPSNSFSRMKALSKFPFSLLKLTVWKVSILLPPSCMRPSAFGPITLPKSASLCVGGVFVVVDVKFSCC